MDDVRVMQRCKNNVDGVCQQTGEEDCPGDRPCADLVNVESNDTIIPADSYHTPSGPGMQYLRMGIQSGPFDLGEKLWFAAMHNELIDECRQAAAQKAMRMGQ